MGKSTFFITVILTAIFMPVQVHSASEKEGSQSSANPLPAQPVSNKRDTPQTNSKPTAKLGLLKKSLDTIYDEYTALPKTSDNVEKLYQLHLRLKNTREEIVKLDSGNDIYDEKYKELGLYIGPFSESLEYSNDLLVEIQSINPDSVHQEEAWYESIYSGRQYGGPGDLDTLKEYLKKYPNGKYSSRIYYDLGNYYSGLYKYLRYGGKSHNDRASCYKQEPNRSLKDQLKEAQTESITLYKKALDLNHDGSLTYEIQLALWNINDGKNTSSDAWCDVAD